MARVVVDVMLKPEILDPQGQAVHAHCPPRFGAPGSHRRPSGQALRARVDGTSTRPRSPDPRACRDPARQHGDRGLHREGREREPHASESSPSRAPSTTATPQRAVRLAGAEPVALWHGDGRPAGRRRRRPARRLLLRRLPALRRHRPLRAGDDSGHRAGRRRPAGPRHLQRLPGPLRVAPAARRADPQRPPALRLPRPAAAGRDDATAWTTATQPGRRSSSR